MKLMVLDGNSILNRSYYGIRPLTTKDGFYTQAIYGFLVTMARLEDEERPDAVCVTFDRLVARQLVARNVHRVEYLLHHRKLHRQLLGHPLALGLVALVLQMAEGRLAPVEGHAHRVGPLLVLQPRHRDQKAVNGLRVKPVFCHPAQ